MVGRIVEHHLVGGMEDWPPRRQSAKCAVLATVGRQWAVSVGVHHEAQGRGSRVPIQALRHMHQALTPPVSEFFSSAG